MSKRWLQHGEETLYERHLFYYRPFSYVYRKNMDRLYLTNKRIHCRSWLPIFSWVFKPLTIEWRNVQSIRLLEKGISGKGIAVDWLDDHGFGRRSLFFFPWGAEHEVLNQFAEIVPKKVKDDVVKMRFFEI